MASPSDTAPEQGSRWDLFGIEACGGDKILVEARQMVSVFIGIYGSGIRSVGPPWAPHGQGRDHPLVTPPVHVAGLWPLSMIPEASSVPCCPKKSC